MKMMTTFDDNALSNCLAEIGYVRLKKFSYKASWSSADVEHFLFFYTWRQGYFIAGDFGLRNPAAEAFAVECMNRFGGMLSNVRFDRRCGCAMRFSLGMLCGWEPLSSFVIQAMPGQTLAEKIKGDIRRILLPIVRPLKSTADLLAFLSEDQESSRWFRISAARRAAMIAYLGQRLSISTTSLEAIIEPHFLEIAQCVGRDESGEFISPSVFVRNVFNYLN